jgi:outer membrane protein insertion porin family
LPLTDSLVLHLGVRSGAIVTSDENSSNVPFVERFFLGGEDTVRGYREGKASPLDENGDEIGAQAYVLTNVELEQRLYSDLSIVVFYDGLYNSQDGFYEDGTEYLYSIGLGLNYKTVVGPVRLEYGYHPDPRKHDTQGTLHLSIGFPF